MKGFDKGLLAVFLVCCLITIDVDTGDEKINLKIENPDDPPDK